MYLHISYCNLILPPAHHIRFVPDPVENLLNLKVCFVCHGDAIDLQNLSSEYYSC